MSPEIAVGAAVNDLLVAALGPVPYYDYVPAADTATPLVALGVIATRRQTATRCGPVWDVGFRLHVMSTAPGRDEAWTILQQLRATLDRREITLADPYAAVGPLREQRSGDMNDRMQAVSMAFIDFDVTVSTTGP